MEGLGDRAFRKALLTIGGFDEAVTEFISVPAKAHVTSLIKEYDAKELSPIPLAAQIMGADSDLMSAVAIELEKCHAPRIDINCGCPSNTVTGRGAGSSLLQTPQKLHDIAKKVVQNVHVPVTIKMRSGFDDISLFEDNLFAAQESGITFLTLHPRTKIDGYTPPARIELIGRAKQLLRIPVIGNGDIVSIEAYTRLLQETHCDGVMIGRGAVRDPFLFQKIKAYREGRSYTPTWNALYIYLTTFLQHLSSHAPERTKISKCKQLLGFLFMNHPTLIAKRQDILRMQPESSASFIDTLVPIIKESL